MKHINLICNHQSLIKFIILIDQYKCEKEKDKANKRILRSLSFDNNGLVKPSCGTVALYGPFGFFLRYDGLSMNNLG
jgi:hypothetical protein